MKKNIREKLIKNSIEIKAFKRDDLIFVNLLTAIKPFAFSCKMKELEWTIQRNIDQLPIISSYSINGETMPYDHKSVFLKIEVDDQKNVLAKFSDGRNIKFQMKDFDYELLTPDVSEIMNVIVANIQEF